MKRARVTQVNSTMPYIVIMGDHIITSHSMTTPPPHPLDSLQQQSSDGHIPSCHRPHRVNFALPTYTASASLLLSNFTKLLSGHLRLSGFGMGGNVDLKNTDRFTSNRYLSDMTGFYCIFSLSTTGTRSFVTQLIPDHFRIPYLITDKIPGPTSGERYIHSVFYMHTITQFLTHHCLELYSVPCIKPSTC